MHNNVQMNPEKSQKFTQHSCCSLLTREINLKAIRGNGYRFVPKGGTFPTENHHACCEKLQFVRSIYPNLPQMGQNLYHGMLMPLHDSMPSFMNFRRVLDLLEFKNRHLNVLPAINGPRWLKFIPISCMGPKHAPKDTDLIFQPIYMHWSMCMYVVQIWIMHIKCIQNSVNAKKCPNEPRKITQHSYYSMLAWEKISKAIRGNI